MHEADKSLEPEQTSRQRGRAAPAADHYHGIELAPKTLESLVTWDISLHAQQEKDRLNSASDR
jgi:hypothetical protein